MWPKHPQGHLLFRVILPTELPKIMGLRGIHSLKALQWWGGLSFCLWFGKGQNEDSVRNHLQTSHYHLGLICSHCVEYFTTSANVMCWHSQLCKLAPPSGDDNQEEESVNNDNSGEYNDEFTFYED